MAPYPTEQEFGLGVSLGDLVPSPWPDYSSASLEPTLSTSGCALRGRCTIGSWKAASGSLKTSPEAHLGRSGPHS